MAVNYILLFSKLPFSKTLYGKVSQPIEAILLDV